MPEKKNCAQQYIECFGTERGALSDAARALGVDRQVLLNWREKGWIPPANALDVEKASQGQVTAREILEEARLKNPPRFKTRPSN